MNVIADYQIISKIYESPNSLVYRAVSKASTRPVILKVLKEDYPTPSELTRYKQEYQITSSLKVDGAIAAYDLLPYKNTLAIVLEDFGGISLDVLMGFKKFSLSEFLFIAIKIADSLGEIHALNVIHKDINPSNIVYNKETKQLKIIDFGISTTFKRENPTIKSPGVLEGTLAYMSPEQTGRMNRALDYRTDFYSLGATFYKILTSQLPFETNDALELVHSHIAKQPVPPHEINSEIPQVVSHIIMKLLAKISEERYQSALGIKADLQECLRQLQQTGKILEFPLADHDISEQLKISPKLYGRETQIENLYSTFKRVVESDPEQKYIKMMLVSGYSGIGKTLLVQELYKPITQQRGYFISGKFNQFQRNIPYSAIISAFQVLVKQLLSESETQLIQWREKLLVALGLNAQVAIDFIPEIEQIIGSQPPVQLLEPTETQNRFNAVFLNFIAVFCQQSHPLVIFLDDLQWADSASLKLIELIMTKNHTGYLLLLGAYRNNEVSSNHPTMITINRLHEQRVIINSIILEPLGIDEIIQLLADTLYCDREKVTFLARLIFQKTRGNPFFINEFLKTIYYEKLLTFESEQNCWQWNITQIEELGITDNVVDLILDRLRKLPEMTQKALRLAACIGNIFDLSTLSIVYKQSISETFRELLPAIYSETIRPLSALETTSETPTESALFIQDYKFSHDRVQQAAYTLIDEEDKKEVHLQIGIILLANFNEKERQEKIFTLVDHLNEGRALIDKKDEKIALAELNLQAAIKAKEAIAYAVSRNYLVIAAEEFPGDIWQENYDMSLKLYKELAEVEYLNGDFKQSQCLIEMALRQAKSALDCTEFYDLQIIQYTLLGKMSEAIESGRNALKVLEIDLAKDNFQAAFEEELAEYYENFDRQKISLLYNWPKMVIPEKRAALKILLRIIAPAWLSDPVLVYGIGTKMVNLNIKYGHMEKSPAGYACFGFINTYVLHDYQLGYQYGCLSIQLSDKYNDVTCKIGARQFHASMIMPWLKHIKFSERVNIEGIDAGIQGGELQPAGYSKTYNLYNLIYQGKNLDLLLKEIDRCLLFSKETQNLWAFYCILSAKIIVQNLVGITKHQSCFDIEETEESHFLETCQKYNLFAAICFHYIFKAQVLYLYDRPIDLSLLEQAREWFDYIPGTISIAKHNFYYSLTLAALYPQASLEEQKKYWQQLESNQQRMKEWADNCPENFLHKYLLVAAEMSRIAGKWHEAIDLYDQAIESAKENEFIHNEALANELAAKFWLNKGKEEFAEFYLKKARQCYQIWGAKRKVEDLEQQYPQCLGAKASGVNKSSINTGTTARESAEKLDLVTVLKASQTISSEIVLDQLLAKLMKIAIENGGAEKGFLILQKDGKWGIEAEGKVDCDDVKILQSIAIDSVEGESQTPILSLAIVKYVIRTQENVVLDNATREGQFIRDPYILSTQPKSILCIPLLHQSKSSGVLYLENNLTTNAFTCDRLEVLKIISTQAAISIQNAQLYNETNALNQNLRQEIVERQKAEVALRESEKQLTQFLEALPVGIFVVDGNGQPKYINQTGQKLLGKGVIKEIAREQLTQTYQVYLAETENLYPTEQQPIIRALKGETIAIDNMEIRQEDKIIPLEVSATPIFDEKGQIVQAIAAFQDITQRKIIEAERVRFTQELTFKNIALEQAKDALAEYSKTLEQKVRERTSELLQTVEILKATQAELVIENTLLKSAEQHSNYEYQVGGSLPMEAPTYVVRSADRYLYKALKQGKFCYIFNARQMGKSSLRVQMMKKLGSEGISCAAIDISEIGYRDVTIQQWYAGFTYRLASSFNILNPGEFRVWWQEYQFLSPVQRLCEFFHQVLLKKISENIVIFIDEIDSVLSLDWAIDDFFILLRSLHNQRADNPNYQRLTFVLLGAATPSQLVQIETNTPFNIGQAIQLNGFQLHEAQPLLAGLQDKVNNPQVVLKEVLSWTNGQPFLTQKICQLIRNSSSLIPANSEAEWVEDLVRSEVIEHWESKDEPEHLKTIRARILNSRQQPNQLLKLYRNILEQGNIVSADSPEEKELLLSGLVIKQNNFLAVHNRIYESIFDWNWLDLTVAFESLRL